MKHYLDAAENAARAAGKLLRENFQRQPRVKAFAAHDIKLEIDVQAQELISKLLLEEFPAHALYGEEGIAGDQSSDHQWIVDPLDGTVNYFYGIPHFCVSIALRLHKELVVGVIYDPVRSGSRRSRCLNRSRQNRRDDQHEFPPASANDSSRAQMPRTRQRGARHGLRGVRTIRRIH
jgi:fructose-1,6-bisphosphatase/inositol monophosphatase family enzyme